MRLESLGDGGDGRFLVLGCQRSGTTLVGMMLEAHRRIEYFGEMDTTVNRAGDLTRELDLDAVGDQPVPLGGRTGFAANRDTHRWAEIRAALPNAAAVWVERDVAPVVASMLSLTVRDGCWASVFGPREIAKHVRANDDEAAAELAAWLATEDPRTRGVGTAALCWAIKREQRRAWECTFGDRLYTVAYEALVLDPEPEARRILAALGCEWDERVLSHPSFVDQTIQRPGRADAGRRIDATGLEKWRETLDDGDLEVVAAIRAGYEQPVADRR